MSFKVDRLVSDLIDPTIPFVNADCALNPLNNDVMKMILEKAFDPYKPKSRVCRRFRQFFNKQIKTWRYLSRIKNFEQVFVAFPNIKIFETHRYLLFGIIHYLQRQRIEEITMHGDPLVCEEPPLQMLRMLHSLKSVTIINSYPNIHGIFWTNLPPSVTRLSLINMQTHFIIPDCDNLQHLNVLNCPGMATARIQFSNLKTLVWEPVPQIDPQLVSHIFKYDLGAILKHFGTDKKWTEKFIELGGDVNMRFSQQLKTTLFWACRPGRLPLLQSLIAHGANVNARDLDNSTPLHEAVLNNADREAYCLIDSGASVHAKNANDGNTPLHECIHPAIMRALLRAGADPNAKNKYGNTPLIVALNSGNAELLRILVAAGARGNQKNNAGQTAYDIAQGRMFPPIFCEILLPASAGTKRLRPEGEQ